MGLFQAWLINPQIHWDLMTEMKTVARSLPDLPAEIKKRNTYDVRRERQGLRRTISSQPLRGLGSLRLCLN
ncbi:hypothetical protein PanWU01x14_202730 [Parasponia andersonii]|uniref:Uncharacterized protein n=1 Tax=Parasponia andersonii TaxID=3476 RepID=A0A2P5BX98_PARAD|nr:hypothetical protein PanWU01x14_202730 [Parasponia andersonii]